MKNETKKSCDNCQNKGDCGAEEDFFGLAGIYLDYMKLGFINNLHEFLAENCEGYEGYY
jgi:hypothetical protein